MSLQMQRWKNYFSRGIYDQISKWEVNFRGVKVTATADATELLATNINKADASTDVYLKPLKISLQVENSFSGSKFRKQTLPFFTLMYIPVLTPEGFKLTSTKFRKYKNFLAPATGWYIKTEKKNKTMWYANSYGRCFTFRHYPDKGVDVVSTKSNGTSSKSRIPIYEFLWAVTGKNYDELDEIFKNFTHSSIDSMIAHSNNKTYEQVCDDAFALFEVNVDKRESKFYTVAQDLQNSVFSSYSNATVEKVIRFKHMESFHRFHGDQLVGVTNIEQYPALRDITLPTDITLKIASLLDEAGVKEIQIKHKQGSVSRPYTITKCDLDKISTKLTPDELVYAMYDFYVYLEGMGKEHDTVDLGHRVLQPIDIFMSTQIEKAMNGLRGKIIENISTGNVDNILKTNDINRLSLSFSSNLLKFMKSKEVFAAPEETNSVASNEQDFRLIQPEKEEVRQIHPSTFCRICPVATPESSKTGINLVLTNYSTIDEYHLICTVVYAVKDGVVDRSKEIKLNALDERNKFIVSYDVDLSKLNKDDVVDCMLNYKPAKTMVRNINYQRKDSYQYNGIASVTQNTNYDGPKRQPMIWQTVRQATPALVPKGAYTTTGFEKLYSTGVIRAEEVIKSFCMDNNVIRPLYDKDKIRIKCLNLDSSAILDAQFEIEGEIYSGDESPYFEDDMNPLEEIEKLKALGEQDDTPFEPVQFRCMTTNYVIDNNKVSTNKTLIKYYMVPAPKGNNNWYYAHDIVFHSGDTALRDSRSMISGKIDPETGKPTELPEEFKNQDYTLAPGYTVNVIFKTFEGYGYEDAVVFRQGFVEQELGLATTYVLKKEDSGNTNRFKYSNHNVKGETYPNLDERGLPIVGTYLYPGDVVIGRQESRGYGSEEWVDSPILLDPKEEGRVINADRVIKGRDQYVSVTLSKILPLTIGDKVSGFHGNKSVTSIIIPDADMPYFASGEKIDMIFDPLGVTSRENVGQIVEGTYCAIGRESDAILYVPPYTSNNTQKLVDYAESKGAKPQVLYDAKTGEPFEKPVFLHTMTIIRSTHIAISKYKAWSQSQSTISETTLQTQNTPTGGQRISELTVSDYLATGARTTLEAFTTLHADDYTGYKNLQNAIANCKVYGEPGTLPENTQEDWYKSDNVNRLQAYLRTLGINMVSTLGEKGKQVTYYEPLSTKACCDLTGGAELNTLTQTNTVGDIDTKLRSLHYDGETVKPESKVFNNDVAMKYHDNYGKMRVPGDHRIILPFSLFNSLSNMIVGIDYGDGMRLAGDILMNVTDSMFEVQLEMFPKLALVSNAKLFKSFNSNFIKDLFNVSPKYHYFYGIIGSKGKDPVTIQSSHYVISGLFVAVKFSHQDWARSRSKCVAIVNHISKVYSTVMIDATARDDSFLDFFKVLDPQTAEVTHNPNSCYNPQIAEEILKVSLREKLASSGVSAEASSQVIEYQDSQSDNLADSLLDSLDNGDFSDSYEDYEFNEDVEQTTQTMLTGIAKGIIDDEEERDSAQVAYEEESMDDLDDDAEHLDGGNLYLREDDYEDEDDEEIDYSDLDDSVMSDFDTEGFVNQVFTENELDLSVFNDFNIDMTTEKNSPKTRLLASATKLAMLCRFNDYYKDGFNSFFTSYVIIPPGLYRPYSDNSWSSALGALTSRLANTNDIVKFYAYLRAGSGRVDTNNKLFPDEKSYASINLVRALAHHASKKCALRDVILVKRIKYAGRSVIYNNPKLRLGEIEVPVRMMTQIFSAHIKAYLNKHRNENPILEHCVFTIQQQAQMQAIGNKTDTTALKVSNFLNEIAVGKQSAVDPFLISLKATKLIDTTLPNQRTYVYEKCYASIKKILEYYSNIYPVDASRDPALHQHSIGCFRYKLVDSVCIGIHPLICHSYNADFDGDQMSVKFPQFKGSIDEIGRTYLFGLKPISCAKGESIIEVDKDMLLGIFYATTGEVSKNVKAVINVNLRDWSYFGDLEFRNSCFSKFYDYIETGLLKCSDTVVINLRDNRVADPKLKNRTYVNTLGRILFNSILTPDCFTTKLQVSNEDCPIKGVYELKFDKQMKSKDIKNLATQFIIDFKTKNDHILFEHIGPFTALDTEYNEFYKFFDRLKDFGFYMADMSGTTLSIWDFEEYCLEDVQTIKPNVEEVSGAVSTFYELGCLSDQSKRDSKLSVYRNFDDMQTKMISKKLNQEVGSSLYNIVVSGARGNVGNLKTICLGVGLVKDSKNVEQETPINNGFLQGLTAEEGLQNSISARRISIQTYRKAPDTGARTRMMTSMVDHVVVDNGVDEENKPVTECNTESTLLQLNYMAEIATLDDCKGKRIMKEPPASWSADKIASYKTFIDNCKNSKSGLTLSDETVALARHEHLDYVVLDNEIDGYIVMPLQSLKSLANYELCKFDTRSLIENGCNVDLESWDAETIKKWNAFIEQLDATDTAHIFIDDIQTSLTARGINRILIEYTGTNVMDTVDKHYQERPLKYVIDPIFNKILYNRIIDVDKYYSDNSEFSKELRESCYQHSKRGKTYYAGTDKTVKVLTKYRADKVAFFNLLGCKGEPALCPRCFGLEYDTFDFPKKGTPIGYLATTSIGEEASQSGFDVHKGASLSKKIDIMDEPSMAGEGVYDTTLSLITEKSNKYRKLRHDLGITELATENKRPILADDDSRRDKTLDNVNVVSYITLGPSRVKLISLTSLNLNAYVLVVLIPQNLNSSQPLAYAMVEKYNLLVYDGQLIDETNYAITRLVPTYKIGQVDTLLQRIVLWKHYISNNSKLLPRNYEIMAFANVENGYVLETTTSKSGEVYYAGEIKRIKELEANGIPYRQQMLGEDTLFNNDNKILSSAIQSNFMNRMCKAVVSHAIDDENSTVLQMVRGDMGGKHTQVNPISNVTEETTPTIHLSSRNSSLIGGSSHRRNNRNKGHGKGVTLGELNVQPSKVDVSMFTARANDTEDFLLDVKSIDSSDLELSDANSTTEFDKGV